MHSATASSSSSSSLGTNASADSLPTALPIIDRPEDKIHRRLVSKQHAKATDAAPSFRVYYSLAPGSVPFLWEASPGTPKHPAAADVAHSTASAIPPLTPPPSYLSSPKTPLRKHGRYSKATRLLAAILPRSASSNGSAWSRMLSPSNSPASSSAYDSPRKATAVYYHDDDCVHGAPGTRTKSSACCFQVAAARPYCCKDSARSR